MSESMLSQLRRPLPKERRQVAELGRGTAAPAAEDAAGGMPGVVANPTGENRGEKPPPKLPTGDRNTELPRLLMLLELLRRLPAVLMRRWRPWPSTAGLAMAPARGVMAAD